MTDNNNKPLSVSEAAFYAKSQFEKIRLTIEGEISQLADKAGYKSVYFDIKDEGASLSCKMWRNRYEKSGVKLRVGALVQISGYFTIWPAKGDLKFEVVSVALAGEGKLRQQVAMLAETLRKEGLMEPQRKIPLPAYPKKIGLVTSPRGAAVHDVLRTLRRRYPMGEILLAGVPVEGQHAAEYLLHGLRCVYKAGAEVILLVRGGGSFEDFMPFNDETLCRAITKCPIPIVTGIGHEPDNSIADMVADFRASTPTAAAEAIAPDFQSIHADLNLLAGRMGQILQLNLNHAQANLDRIASRPVFCDSYALLSDDAQGIDYMAERLQRAIPGGLQRDSVRIDALQARLRSVLPGKVSECETQLRNLSNRFEGVAGSGIRKESDTCDALFKRLLLKGDDLLSGFESQLALGASRLNDLSPLSVLGRGFSLTRDSEGAIVKSVKSVAPGERISVTVSDGAINCTVDDTNAS